MDQHTLTSLLRRRVGSPSSPHHFISFSFRFSHSGFYNDLYQYKRECLRCSSCLYCQFMLYEYLNYNNHRKTVHMAGHMATGRQLLNYSGTPLSRHPSIADTPLHWTPTTIPDIIHIMYNKPLTRGHPLYNGQFCWSQWCPPQRGSTVLVMILLQINYGQQAQFKDWINYGQQAYLKEWSASNVSVSYLSFFKLASIECSFCNKKTCSKATWESDFS